MKITQVEYSKTFNLGNYQGAKIGFVAQVEVNEDPTEVLLQVMNKTEHEFASRFETKVAPRKS